MKSSKHSEEGEISEEEKYRNVLRAVEGGDNKAKTKLAWYKLSGYGGAEIDEGGATMLLKERVKNKDVEAMWMLGLCYEYGMGCEQDLTRAETLYDQSCDGGNVIGKFLKEARDNNARGSGMMKVRKGLR